MNDTTSRLAVAGLEKSFGAVRVLDGISLTARQGDVVSILGASGSGKSTFLRCLNFLETADAGTITIKGDTVTLGQCTIAEERKRALRLHTGFVFQ
ncbi:MAG: ATP-binding cassette domain-containing protein, partial [Hyphomonadaceae bacterium]